MVEAAAASRTTRFASPRNGEKQPGGWVAASLAAPPTQATKLVDLKHPTNGDRAIGKCVGS